MFSQNSKDKAKPKLGNTKRKKQATTINQLLQKQQQRVKYKTLRNPQVDDAVMNLPRKPNY